VVEEYIDRRSAYPNRMDVVMLLQGSSIDTAQEQSELQICKDPRLVATIRYDDFQSVLV
jgi:hypothetical protein